MWAGQRPPDQGVLAQSDNGPLPVENVPHPVEGDRLDTVTPSIEVPT